MEFELNEINSITLHSPLHSQWILQFHLTVIHWIISAGALGASKGVPSRGGVPHQPTPSPPPTFLKSVGILTKCVGKISWPNVVGKFGVFYHKKRNAEFYQYPVPQKSNFYRWGRLLKKLYKICANNYDNNEYSAVNYIIFFTNNIIWCL